MVPQREKEYTQKRRDGIAQQQKNEKNKSEIYKENRSMSVRFPSNYLSTYILSIASELTAIFMLFAILYLICLLPRHSYTYVL